MGLSKWLPFGEVPEISAKQLAGGMKAWWEKDLPTENRGGGR